MGYCKNCGYVRIEHFKFCGQCGTKYDWNKKEEEQLLIDALNKQTIHLLSSKKRNLLFMNKDTLPAYNVNNHLVMSSENQTIKQDEIEHVPQQKRRLKDEIECRDLKLLKAIRKRQQTKTNSHSFF